MFIGSSINLEIEDGTCLLRLDLKTIPLGVRDPGGAINASIELTTTTVYKTDVALLTPALPELGTALPQQNLHLHTQYSNLQSTFSKPLFEFL